MMKQIRDQALLAAAAYQQRRGRKRPEWKRLTQAEMAVELMEAASLTSSAQRIVARSLLWRPT
jgi:hypothetical protein